MAIPNTKSKFIIVDLSLIDSGLTYEQAAIVAYIKRWEGNCFASLAYIAHDLRLSETSTKRHIKRLLSDRILLEIPKGRGRVLAVNETELGQNDPGQNGPHPGQNGPDWGQNGPDPGQNGLLYNNTINNTKDNNYKNYTKHIGGQNDPDQHLEKISIVCFDDPDWYKD